MRITRTFWFVAFLYDPSLVESHSLGKESTHSRNSCFLEQVLLPEGVQGAEGRLVLYKVTVHTSDIRGASTDATITLQILGDKAITGGLSRFPRCAVGLNAGSIWLGTISSGKLNYLNAWGRPPKYSFGLREL